MVLGLFLDFRVGLFAQVYRSNRVLSIAESHREGRRCSDSPASFSCGQKGESVPVGCCAPFKLCKPARPTEPLRHTTSGTGISGFMNSPSQFPRLWNSLSIAVPVVGEFLISLRSHSTVAIACGSPLAIAASRHSPSAAFARCVAVAAIHGTIPARFKRNGSRLTTTRTNHRRSL
jgi:hypothetical protein